MRTFRLIGMALLAIVMCVNFSSCSDDEEGEISASLEGIWYYDYGEGWEIPSGNKKESWSTDPDPYNPNNYDASVKIEIKKVGEHQYAIARYYYDHDAWEYSGTETITLNGKNFKYNDGNCRILTLTSTTFIFEAVDPDGAYYDKYTYIKI